MKRVILVATLLAVGSVSVALKASQQAPVQPSAKALDAEKLKDNLWVLKGAGSGGNTAVFVTATGVVIVDTKNPGWGQPIIEKVRELTDKPITTIINAVSSQLSALSCQLSAVSSQLSALSSQLSAKPSVPSRSARHSKVLLTAVS